MLLVFCYPFRGYCEVKLDAGSQINDKRGTVEFKKKVAGMMTKPSASIADERAGGK